jgi:hypothetical protein
MDFNTESTYWSTLYNISEMDNDTRLTKIYKIYSEIQDDKLPCEPIECDPVLPTEPTARRRKLAKEARKSRAKPAGQDKRWSPQEKTKITKGSPADQKAKKIAMDIKRQRKWIEPFLAEPICHDLVIHNNKKVRVRSPIYDKPCGGVVANYCNSKWPTCPNQGMTTIYIAPRWPN